MPPKHENSEHQKDGAHPEHKERVPPKDKADRRAEEYENEQHERAGTKNRNETPSHQGKPKSVR